MELLLVMMPQHTGGRDRQTSIQDIFPVQFSAARGVSLGTFRGAFSLKPLRKHPQQRFTSQDSKPRQTDKEFSRHKLKGGKGTRLVAVGSEVLAAGASVCSPEVPAKGEAP